MISRTPKPAPDTPRGRRLPPAMILGGLFTVLLIVTIFLTLDGGRAAADEYGDPLIRGCRMNRGFSRSVAVSAMMRAW